MNDISSIILSLSASILNDNYAKFLKEPFHKIRRLFVPSDYSRYNKYMSPEKNNTSTPSPEKAPAAEQEKPENQASPRWPTGFKLIIALLIIVGFFILLFYFKEYV
ncbi:MAG TPA: hypothetical protein VLR89_08300, partial [Anaerolineaceae bacterium]|nr:hypothetical protein [Anaerolineaceae bacterium]